MGSCKLRNTTAEQMTDQHSTMSALGKGKPKGQPFATRNMFNPEITQPANVVAPGKRGRRVCLQR